MQRTPEQLIGFEAVAAPDAEMLILGSMPGSRSLDAQQYYAHPRNAFWPILARLFAFSATSDYPTRLQQLIDHRIALWDVARLCIRPGSLDADIRAVEPNDFSSFLAAHHHIRLICFNGQKAEALFLSLVQPHLSLGAQQIPKQRLPSTSPAHAAISREEKLAAWQVIRHPLEFDRGQP